MNLDDRRPVVHEVMSVVERLPKVPLLRGPTPLESCPQFGAMLGGANVLIKRDDLGEPLFGGNKARLMEVVLGHVKAMGADTIMCSAPVDSNLCRTVANLAGRHGYRAMLFLRGPRPTRLTANALLAHAFGAEIKYLTSAPPHDWVQAEAEMNAARERLEADGHRCFLMLPKITRRLTAVAYTLAMAELCAQLDELPFGQPEALYVASSAGGTHIGCLLGLRACGYQTIVVAHRNHGVASDLMPQTQEVLSDFCATYDVSNLPEGASEIIISDRFSEAFSSAEGKEAVLHAISTLGRTEGILVDPHYTAKVVACIIHDLRRRAISEVPIVFLHTGGIPLLFSDEYDLSGLSAVRVAGAL